MIKKLKAQFNNEEGNIILFVLGMLSIIMILFVFVLNMGMGLAVKEQSGTTANQASMAASSVLYEEVRQVIFEYENDTLEGALQAFFEDIEEKVDDKASDLSGSFTYSDWSTNEIELEAFDIVLKEELDTPVIREKLNELLADEDIESQVIDKAKQTIVQNGGQLDGAELQIESNRIHVRAANEFESTSYDGIMAGIRENVFQESAGPKIDFLEDVWNTSNTIQLN
ncbi:hypothetical protein J2Z83_003579 [Virgibacillus natechei]|uniref:Flp pilus-assembly TadG-like N-terminal domain-containing protein n=1 Tax=Virgibacillus natechei TaxID=1216297 RepID=A0ABS4IKF2_9BACI|nr:Tad domain-containing protein [Virgibacillus natechei]MBP1971440.1 hypothetical protein [Virgibacillus natechei]UZD13810.1 Tad domain-containing protein [Virgibacillus natechei]